MLITVTQALLDADKVEWTGRRCNTCPVALAINPLLKPEFNASVVGSHFYIYREGERRAAIALPSEVKSKIALIDDRKKVDPFDFEISIPAEYLCGCK